MPLDDKNNQKDSSSGHKGIFNQGRLSREILPEHKYLLFTDITFFSWLILIAVIWYFRIDIQVTREIITTISASSVELAGLALTVLTVLHEFNKEDRYFKYGLFLVAIFFGFVVLCGFYLTVTWCDAYNEIQHIEAIIVTVLIVSWLGQRDWERYARRYLPRRFYNLNRPAFNTLRFSTRAVPFIAPFWVIWFSGLNKLTGTLVVFGGALIALLALMIVTMIAIIFSHEDLEEPPHAPGRGPSTEISPTEQLPIKIITAIEAIQTEKQNLVSDEHPVPLIEKDEIIFQLRQDYVLENRDAIEYQLMLLVRISFLYSRDQYDGPYWMIREKRLLLSASNKLLELAFYLSGVTESRSQDDLIVEDGLIVTQISRWLAIKNKLPEAIIREFILPLAVHQLRDRFQARNDIAAGNRIMFVQSSWRISADEWKSIYSSAFEEARQKWSNRNTHQEPEEIQPDQEIYGDYHGINNLQSDHPNAGNNVSEMIQDQEFQNDFYRAVLLQLPHVVESQDWIGEITADNIKQLLNIWQAYPIDLIFISRITTP